MKIGRIASANVKHIISRENGKYRRVGNPRNKNQAVGIARNIPNSIILWNQKNGNRYHNIYQPLRNR
jgi:hypothetical protein